MSRWPYSEEELETYFKDSDSRARKQDGNRISRFWNRKFSDDRKVQAATLISYLVILGVAGTLTLGLYFTTLLDELPPMRDIENPEYELATIAYTADGEELSRYAKQNRSWVSYDEISPHVINALWSTEDHRFYAHWGIDMFRTMAIPYHVLLGDPQGGSTISQQLARNLYNERIGRRVTVSRKLKEMVTAVQLERRYTKNEIIVMYLNTVDFGNQSYGIEAAARTYFGKHPRDLNELEAATLIGLLQAVTTYDPIRRPENARRRRNTVLSQMVRRRVLPEEFLAEHRDDPVEATYHSAAITRSIAPHFAAEVEKRLKNWAAKNDQNIYEDGLIVWTTIDSRMQEVAMAVADSLMPCLQAAVDFEWSPQGGDNDAAYYTSACSYKNETIKDPWGVYWRQNPGKLNQVIRNTDRFRSMRRAGAESVDAVAELKTNAAFMDSVKTAATRLETGFVAMDPQTGYVRAWIGGREIEKDWYDHVSQAARQPGSTFKPFVYTAAIDNGWSPYDALLDDSLHYEDPVTHVIWNPGNFGNMTGGMLTLREGLAQSKNTISARLILDVTPQQAALYARRMGIDSPLDEVPSLALGTSDVTLLEMTKAYSTFANGGLLYQPTLISRIEDRNGNVLYEAEPAPREALSESTAYTMVDMLHGVLRTGGSGVRISGPEFNLRDYDLAGKTGTTQNAADTWFMMIHPDLVMGSWVGFNDPALSFRTSYWGQGAHTALYMVGHFFDRLAKEDNAFISRESRFPSPSLYGIKEAPNPFASDSLEAGDQRRRRRVDW